MRFEGGVFEYLDENGRVLEAEVTDQKIVLSYENGDGKWAIVATSTDSCLYNGVLGAIGAEPNYVVELAIFRGKTGAVMVFGSFRDDADSDIGEFLFRLFPSADKVMEKKSKKTNKARRKST